VTGQNFERALTRASLSTSFDPDRLIENEPTRFTATVVYARQLDPGPKIDVAYANDAELNPLDPRGDVRLKAAVIIATQSGDRALEQRIEKPVAKVADPAPSFWGPIQSIIAGLSGLIGLVVAVAGLAKIFPSQWKWVRRKLRLSESGPTQPTPPTP